MFVKHNVTVAYQMTKYNLKVVHILLKIVVSNSLCSEIVTSLCVCMCVTVCVICITKMYLVTMTSLFRLRSIDKINV